VKLTTANKEYTCHSCKKIISPGDKLARTSKTIGYEMASDSSYTKPVRAVYPICRKCAVNYSYDRGGK
jgi:RNase P subunit RPR2